VDIARKYEISDNPDRGVLLADNYLPFGQDNGTPTGSETYKFIGKPWNSAIGLYDDYQQ